MSPVATAELRISEQLQLPVDAMTEAIALLSTRGRGKTHTATVIAEEVLKLQHQVVIVDPVGLYWGLRSSADGKSEGYRILVLGGPHGDLPLQASDAETIARFVVEEELSVVLDLSALPTKSEQVRFCETFFDRLWHLKQAHRSPLLLVLEESQEFAPQRPQRNEAVMLGRIERIAKLGRNYGIGLLMITQRPASLNKDVLDLAGILILLGLVAPIERKVARDWISGHGDQRLGDEVLASLPGLPKGDAWLWWPLQGILKRLHVRQRETFDSSATPKVGHKRIEPGKRAEIDLDAFKAKLGGLIEKAKADDPRELRKRIAELEREVAGEKKRLTPTRTVIEEKILEVVPEEVRDAANSIANIAAGISNALANEQRTLKTINELAERILRRHTAQPKGRVAQPAAGAGVNDAHERGPLSPPSLRSATVKARPVPSSAGGKLTGPEQRLLDALAWCEAVHLSPAKREIVAFLASYKPNTGTFNTYLGGLRTAGLIDYPGGGLIALTEAGRGQANYPDAPGTTEQLQAAVLSRLDGPQRRLLEPLIAAYPDSMSRDELAAASGYTANTGTYNTYLGGLRSLGVIDYPARGQVVALPVLFLEDR